MKKLLFLLLTTTFLLISFLSIKQFEYLQFQSFNSSNIEENFDVIIEDGNPQYSKLENYQLLVDTAREAKVNLQRVSYELDENNKNKIVYYVALGDETEYFNELKLTSGKYLNHSSNHKDFLSTIQTNQDHQIGQLELFHSYDPIEIRPLIAAERSKDLKGTYSINNKDGAEKFKKIGTEKGLIIKVSKVDGQSLLTSYPYQDMMYKGSIVLCLLIMLAMMYDVANNYKEIAVRLMFGYSFFQLGLYLVKKYFTVFIGSILVSYLGLIVFLYFYNQYQQFGDYLYYWLGNLNLILMSLLLIFTVTLIGTNSINISQMIKNKKPIKLFFYLNIIVRFIIAIFLLLGLQQAISKFQDLKNTVSKEENWALLKNYSYLGIIASNEKYNFENDVENRDNLQQLYKDFESQGAFYISPSNYYLDSSIKLNHEQNQNPWGNLGRKVEINKNYLDVNPIKDVNNKNITISKSNENEVTVLVPLKYKKFEHDIKDTIASDYGFFYKLDETITLNVNIIYIQNNQTYFTFSTYMGSDDNFEIKDPIAVIINPMFDPFYLSNTMSRGEGYYLKVTKDEKPFKVIKETLKKYNLDDVWEPVSIAYSNVELNIANDKESLQITTIYSVLLIVLACVLLFFTAIYYLELNKQSLALQWIFGYNFFEKHNLAYLSILVFWNLTFMVCFFLADHTDLLIKITIGLAVFDIVLTSILLIFKEYNVTKDVLIEK